MKKTFRPLGTDKTKETQESRVFMANGIPPRTMPKNVPSGFFTNVAMRANRAGNKIKLIQSISMIQGSSKNVTHNGLVNWVMKGKIKGSSIYHINGLFLP